MTRVFEMNARLGRGVNLGDALDAEPGVEAIALDAEIFDAIKEAGFDSVRLPVRWSAHADDHPPFRLKMGYLRQIERAVEQAAARSLAVIVDVHHYRQAMIRPETERERFVGLWRQIARSLNGFSVDALAFELLNEPDAALTPELWNSWLTAALDVVRETNADRAILIGPGEQNSIDRLGDLRLPVDDNLIVTVHYYEPFSFTHQGAEWLQGVDTQAWLGTTWGSDDQAAAVESHLARAAAWGAERGRPINVGEFGSIRHADEESRRRWTTHVARLAQEHGMSSHYWDFAGSSFGLYDRSTASFRRSLLRAALPDGRAS